MRIIAGEKRSMQLKSPKGRNTRPTLDMVRESLFMILRDELEGARVLDLFAGAGTLGLEALSRGATHTTFIELSQPVSRVLRANIRHLNFRDRTEMIKADVLRHLGRCSMTGEAPDQPFTLVLMDPPYGEGLADRALERLGRLGEDWLERGALVVAEVGKRDGLKPAYGKLKLESSRKYRDTRVDLYRFAE